MELKLKETYERLNKKKIIIETYKIKEYLNEAKNMTIKLIENLLENNTGFERDKKIGVGSEHNNISGGQGTNPALWELGHIAMFYDYHLLRYYDMRKYPIIDNWEIYDSFITNRETRFKFKKHSKEKLLNYYLKVINTSIDNLKDLDVKSSYLYLLSILHNHMHIESFIFTSKLLKKKNVIHKNILNQELNYKMKLINIEGGYFLQGTKEGENLIAFDNEMSQFKTYVNNFLISNIPVTQGIFLKFLLEGGYENDILWSKNGKKWKKEKKINKPMYWEKINDKWRILNFDKYEDIRLDLPMCHINWYEARAIAKWLGGRLPIESEWEYLSTNKGKTKFPWGNEMDCTKCNINYKKGLVSVEEYKEGNNNDGVQQLIGNIWEWCEDPFYPYDGFVIDSVYREFSYPFFGFKKILRGGCWAVPDILINSRYRNAQMPDMRMQFTGVRIAKNI
jgi:gamma-glutamyl hercynylcysteine S-oxide synthase